MFQYQFRIQRYLVSFFPKFFSRGSHYSARTRDRVHKAKRLFITALFSSIIFVTNFFVPPPINNVLIVVQAIMLALAALFVGKAGATYVGLVGGVLSALSRPAFGPFTFLFTFLYGVLVDGSFYSLKVYAANNFVNRNKVILGMAFSTGIIGFSTYYIFAVFTNVIPFNFMLSGLMVFLGVGSGITAGYAASYLWNKYLKNITT
jgi:uncharacterized membrane protein